MNAHLTMYRLPDTFILARIVHAGERYGRNGCLTDSKETMVEFYDSRYDCDPWTGVHCQFVSRYFARTLLERPVSGLCLDGGVPEWRVGYHGMVEVCRLIALDTMNSNARAVESMRAIAAANFG